MYAQRIFCFHWRECISLQVDDIDVLYQELTDKGVEFEGPPAEQPWGGVLAHFKDPDGDTITLLGSANVGGVNG
jgi:predicted enzyme related to lactoylglutathione lyase